MAQMVNCGYARVAMKNLSEEVDHFSQLFQEAMNIDDNYFTSSHGSKYPSQFELHSRKIKNAFSKRWHPQSDKLKYEKDFSIEKWDHLPWNEKLTHKLTPRPRVKWVKTAKIWGRFKI